MSLQWGRAQSSAEMLVQFWRITANANTASMGPRSIERGNFPVTFYKHFILLLQWGRAQSSAEIRGHRPGRQGTHLASMGPRSIERGNCARRPNKWPNKSGFNGAALNRARKLGELGEHGGKRSLLQWGRAQSSAEMRPRWATSQGNSALQWGRAQSSAEMAAMGEVLRSHGKASMGPRSIERGNVGVGGV